MDVHQISSSLLSDKKVLVRNVVHRALVDRYINLRALCQQLHASWTHLVLTVYRRLRISLLFCSKDLQVSVEAEPGVPARVT